MSEKNPIEIRIERILLELTDRNLDKVAKAIGVSPMSLYRLSSGVTKKPTNLMLVALENYLNIQE